MSLAFSGDGRYLAAQGGAPDWALSLWVWEKSKLVASVRTAAAAGHTAVQCTFQPGARGGRRVAQGGHEARICWSTGYKRPTASPCMTLLPAARAAAGIHLARA